MITHTHKHRTIAFLIASTHTHTLDRSKSAESEELRDAQRTTQQQTNGDCPSRASLAHIMGGAHTHTRELCAVLSETIHTRSAHTKLTRASRTRALTHTNNWFESQFTRRRYVFCVVVVCAVYGTERTDGRTQRTNSARRWFELRAIDHTKY